MGTHQQILHIPSFQFQLNASDSTRSSDEKIYNKLIEVNILLRYIYFCFYDLLFTNNILPPHSLMLFMKDGVSN